MPLLYYLPDERYIEVDETDTILTSSLYAGIPHTHVCGSSARCSTCRVWVLEGLEYCSPRNDAEENLAKRLCFDPKMRLACQTQILGEGKVGYPRPLELLKADGWEGTVSLEPHMGMIFPEGRWADGCRRCLVNLRGWLDELGVTYE